MALARVVTFDGVDANRMREMQQELEGQERPEGIAATEFVVLYDADAEQAVAMLFFDNEDDYTQADAALNAMPTDQTPGRRTSVKKYEVAFRMAD